MDTLVVGKHLLFLEDVENIVSQYWSNNLGLLAKAMVNFTAQKSTQNKLAKFVGTWYSVS
jgi:hypothetical protein